jgi:hypothetical protein
MFQPYMATIRLATREQISTQLLLGLGCQCFSYVLYNIYHIFTYICIYILYNTYGQTDRQTDMTNQIVAFRNFANAPEECKD